jgi:hypothetical protein
MAIFLASTTLPLVLTIITDILSALTQEVVSERKQRGKMEAKKREDADCNTFKTHE